VLTHLGFPSIPERERVAVADLSSAQLKSVYLGVLVALASVVVVVCRQPAQGTPPRHAAIEASIVLLATTWVSPVVWAYHHVAAVPALAVVLGRKWRSFLFVYLLAAFWLLSLGLMGWDLARGAGEMLWMSLLLGLLLVVSLRREKTPAALMDFEAQVR
jgi:hypothetical protein